jgi:hypothetical protein
MPRFSFARWMKSFLGLTIINDLNDLNRERMETGNREMIGDRRRMRGAVRRRYLTAFDIQSILEITPEAVLHEWPISGILYAVAQFWDILSRGLVLGHPPLQYCLFPGFIALTPAVVFRVELTESYNEFSIIGLANGIGTER